MLAQSDALSVSYLDNDDFTQENASTAPIMSNAHSGAIACIVESRGNATEIGVAILNSTESQCHVYQFMDSPSFDLKKTIFERHNVSTVVMSEK